MNIALVVLDTVRKDTFDDNFEWLPGLRFESAYSTSHWTIPAHGSLLTGVYPSEHGARAKSRYFDTERDSIVEQLQHNNYRTRALSSNPNISKYFNFDRGFDKFYEARKSNGYTFEQLFDWSSFVQNSEKTGIRRDVGAIKECLKSDDAIIPSLREGLNQKVDLNMGGDIQDKGAQAALKKLKQMKFEDNEFLFINLMEAHGPYVVPDQYYDGTPPDALTIEDTVLEAEEDCDPAPRRRAYDTCVEYLSDIYRQIFELLKEDFDYIFTLSDHGEMFGENGWYGHEFGIYPELTHVPICVYDGNDEIRYRKEPTSILDIHKTIIDLADLEAESRGTDLLSKPTENKYLTEYHGLYERLVEKFRDNGVNKSEVQKMDQIFRGLVTNSGYQGDAIDNDFDDEELVEKMDSPADTIEAMVSSLDICDPGGANVTTDSVKERLRELGYV